MKQLRIGEAVHDASGRPAGLLERIVVDEGAHNVSHLVVAGRLIPIGRFHTHPERGLSISFTADRVADFPMHGEGVTVAPGDHWDAPEGFHLSDFLAVAGAVLGGGLYVPPTHAPLAAATELSELISGSPVWSGEHRIGTVVEAMTDERGHVRRLIMRRAGLMGGDVIIPIERVIEVVGPNVHVELTATDLELLEPYSG